MNVTEVLDLSILGSMEERGLLSCNISLSLLHCHAIGIHSRPYCKGRLESQPNPFSHTALQGWGAFERISVSKPEKFF